MDEVGSPLRPRHPRGKNSFQLEIESKLRDRRSRGLAADITSEESEDEPSVSSGRDMMLGTMKPQPRGSAGAKGRGDLAGSTWQGGLGETMRTQDLEKLLGRKTPTNFDREDDEVASTLRNKASTSPSFGLSQRKTPTGKEGLFGRKTPTSPLAASPKAAEMSKEDIIFGRKTPTQSTTSQLGRGGLSPKSGGDFPNLGGQQPWQPPNFRNVSPSAERQSPVSLAGSQGRRTPGLDSGLDPISEKRERSLGYDRYDRRGSPGLSEDSPRSDRPTPRARAGSKQPDKEPARPSRTTPTLDIFGKSRKESSASVEKDLKKLDGKGKDKEDDYFSQLYGRKTPTGKDKNDGYLGKQYGRKTPTDKEKDDGYLSKLYGRKTPTDSKSPGPDRRFDGEKKSPRFERSSSGNRKSPGVDRQTASAKIDFGGRKSPAGSRSKSPVASERRGLLDKGGKFASDRGSPDRRSPDRDLLGRDDRQKKPEESGSLLAFLTGGEPAKPKPRRGKDTLRTDIQMDDKPKQPAPRRSKIPKDEHKAIYDIGEVPEERALAPPPQRKSRFADDSSICEDVREDPTAPHRRPTDTGDTRKSGKQRTDRQAADDAISKVMGEQGRIDFKPVKKVRPVSASAKVQHRPKPRYGTLPGQTSKEAAVPEFNSTMDIRDAVYEDWYRKRMKAAKEEQKAKQKKEEEEAKKKKEAEEEKRTEAMLSYKAWDEQKKELIAQETARKKRAEEKKREKELRDREDKRKEAEVTFKIWKERKDEVIISKVEKEKTIIRDKKEMEREEKRQKEKENMTAFKGWKSRKDVELKQKVKTDKKAKSMVETNLLATQKQKEEEAELRYEEWMHNKEKQDHRKIIEQRRRDLYNECDFRPAWSPANHTVPFGR